MSPAIPVLNCPAAAEPRSGLNGIRRIAVLDGQSQIAVTFFRPLTALEQSVLLNPRVYSLNGGQRLFPKVRAAAMAAPDRILLTLDTEGDFSVYTLSVNGGSIDPLFASRKLRFRLGCDARFDCRPDPPPAPPAPEIPVAIDYLAKDYSSFRQALLDFIPARLPEWTERSPADIGIMILELLAYTADSLSYTQDRVANEAFLETATQRRSVAGHLALIGYEMDEGAAAYTWLHFEVSSEVTLSADSPLRVSNDRHSENEPLLIFETLTGARLLPEHNRMPLYQFGSADCCLSKVAVSATLEGTFDKLQAGDWVLFEEQDHRDAVRLIAAPELAQAGGTPAGPALTIIRWSPATPLHHDYCASRASVRGNLVLATHGETVTDGPRSLAGEQQIPRIRQRLRQSPLAHLDSAALALVGPLAGAAASFTGTAAFTDRGLRSVSTLRLTVDGAPWKQLPALLESGPDDKVFRVEIDDRGEASIVFGNGVFGEKPRATAVATATYRVGGGAIGNLGADTLTVPRSAIPNVTSVTNPLPATGGRNFESRDHARRVAPFTFQKPLTAVTAADYQAAAQEFKDAGGGSPVQRANASFRWTGSWLTVFLAADPRGSEALSSDISAALLRYLDGRRLAGYDLALTRANYVPLEIEIEFCALPGFLAADITERLKLRLSASSLPGAKGFFHPDNFTFGDRLYVSRLFSAAMEVAGVESIRIARMARLHAAQPLSETAVNLARGYLEVGADQIVRLDNDRNFPENGTLTVNPRGTAL